MKKLILFLVLMVGGLKSQTVGYNYDLCGNRIQRVLGVSSTNRVANNDTTRSHYEPTMQFAMEYGISVYPNPTLNDITIVTNKIPEGESASIILYDNTGRLLKTLDKVETREEISLRDFKPGIYNVAIIISTKDKLYYKIIKQ